ncbi:MAG: AsmA family protein, partial [Hyphomicrobiaceae bacterium]
MNNFLVAIGVFLIVVLGALFAVPAFVDWNGYRGVFEEEASRVLGREVRVGGAVNLRLLPSPYFRFEKVRIADAPGVAGQPFIRADSLTVWLAVPPLLRGVVEANDIEIEKPVVNIGFDKSGAGNWQSLGQGSTASIYLPRDISLQSLKLRQATVTLRGSDGGQGLRLEDLNGELSAPALEGPYKFRGTFGAGQQNEIRFATAKPEPDGAVRFKGSVRIDSAGPTYALDGRLVDPMGTPRIDGELTATIPVSAPGASAAAGVAVPVDTPAFEFKAALDGHAGGATLQNIALTFEQGGRPQLLSGGARVDWSSRLAINADLTSRWLDLNRVLGLREGDRPLDALLAFAGRLGGALPADATTTATIAVDQANLGSDSISGLRLGVTKSADRLAITELSAGLPGGTQVE